MDSLAHHSGDSGCGCSKPPETDDGGEFTPRREFILLAFLAVAFLAALGFQGRLAATPGRWVEYAVFLTIYLAAGWEVIAKAVRNVFRGQIFDENFLMTVSTLGAIAVHALPEAVAVMLFYRIGEFFQNVAVNKSRRSVKALLEVRPDSASLLTEEGDVRVVAPEEVAVGDTVVVKPGAKIPLDGVVMTGATQVDTSALTGESVPREAVPGDSLMAGMINLTGLVTVEVTKAFGESSVARILELVENATHRKARTERFFTTFARRYTPAVVLLALLTATLPPLMAPGQTFTDWIYRALVILVISCPCALVVSIPLTYFGGIGAASRNGILVKGSDFLDALTAVRTVFFDKTGTISKGIFKVTQIVAANGYSQEEVLKFAALAEAHSNHPIALSIRKAYGRPVESSEVGEYREEGGSGILAVVDGREVLAGNDRMLHAYDIDHDLCDVAGTVVHVAVDRRYAGHLVIGDEIKDDSAAALAELKALGVEDLVMLTGDGDHAARVMAERTGVDHYHANLLPEDKVAIVERQMAAPGRRGKTAFVGDGINDAPVLARADIGISMGALGSDAAIETADVVVMDDSLRKISLAIRIARQNRAILIQNIVFALVVKSAFIILGFFGIASMWEAVFGDMGVALIAILNATRMLHAVHPLQ